MASRKGIVIGGILGALTGGPIGAAAGAAIGHFFFDKPRNDAEENQNEARRFFKGESRSQADHIRLIEVTFSLMGYISRGAGRINEDHIRQAENVMDTMHLDVERKQIAINAFNRGKSENFDLHAELSDIRSLIRDNVALIGYLFEIQVEIALADGELSPGEHERLLNIADIFGIRHETVERILNMRKAEQEFAKFAESFRKRAESFRQQGNYSQGEENREDSSSDYKHSSGYSGSSNQGALKNAYTILELPESASWEEVKKAHKKLMLKYHPDRLAAQGIPPEMARIYTKKTQDIQSAYDLIRSHLGKN